MAHKKKHYHLMIDKPCKVSIFHYRKTKREADVMNLEKLICDAMTTAGIYKDDKLVYDFHTTKTLGCAKNQIEILVEEILYLT